jgi:hypothetical protein
MQVEITGISPYLVKNEPVGNEPALRDHERGVLHSIEPGKRALSSLEEPSWELPGNSKLALKRCGGLFVLPVFLNGANLHATRERH